MKAVLATIIIIHQGKYPQFAGVWYQGMSSDNVPFANIIIDPENSR